MKVIIIILIGVLFFCCSPKPGDKPPYDTSGFNEAALSGIDSLFNFYTQSKKIPGGVALVARKGKVIYHKAFGRSDIEADKAQKTDDIFRIASMTKPITAVAAMMLYDEGKFSLDDPIEKFIPDFADMQILDSINLTDSTFTAHRATNKITVRHLFTHSSGIGYGFQDEKLMALYEKAGITEGVSTF